MSHARVLLKSSRSLGSTSAAAGVQELFVHSERKRKVPKKSANDASYMEMKIQILFFFHTWLFKVELIQNSLSHIQLVIRLDFVSLPIVVFIFTLNKS